MGLERGPLSLVSTTEELLGSNNRGCGLESREYGCRYSSRWPLGTLYPQKLALTSLTSGGRLVGIVRLRTEAMEFFFFITVSVPALQQPQPSSNFRVSQMQSEGSYISSDAWFSYWGYVARLMNHESGRACEEATVAWRNWNMAFPARG
jgi:hypothetical protein